MRRVDVVCEIRLDAAHRVSEYISAHASLHSTHPHMIPTSDDKVRINR